MIQQPLTVDQFLDARYDLPDSGQWAELDAGRVTLFQPPDLDHGNTILNLSKAIAAWAAAAEGAYAASIWDSSSVATPIRCGSRR
jgi:hypothetical protein